MKKLKAIGLPAILAVVCMQLFGGCGVKYTPANELGWSKWGEPKVTSDMWEGTSIWQMRTNLETGEVQMKCQRVSEHGGYK